ncbi:isoleucyl-tRNA synthetase [Micromonospora jinlongensis]|uniref:Isoleucyl-tRNA synthetase n=1 Tax=Micromonospora jinlongensis TaxID=1287877 RepID=A0A7Y9X3Q2_9ACTN|nr:isoleucyl-tRNA synthetase [Micromonospora jinlongensis]
MHARGRALKDVFQRYRALRGYHQRYQNGYGCQGLWIEVGVEKKLGLNSKPEIEAYRRAKFARSPVRQLTRARIVGPTRPG